MFVCFAVQSDFLCSRTMCFSCLTVSMMLALNCWMIQVCSINTFKKSFIHSYPNHFILTRFVGSVLSRKRRNTLYGWLVHHKAHMQILRSHLLWTFSCFDIAWLEHFQFKYQHNQWHNLPTLAKPRDHLLIFWKAVYFRFRVIPKDHILKCMYIF